MRRTRARDRDDMSETRLEREPGSIDDSLSDEAAEQVPAWERLEAGRYMPRRIRGSLRGRELG